MKRSFSFIILALALDQNSLSAFDEQGSFYEDCSLEITPQKTPSSMINALIPRPNSPAPLRILALKALNHRDRKNIPNSLIEYDRFIRNNNRHFASRNYEAILKDAIESDNTQALSDLLAMGINPNASIKYSYILSFDDPMLQKDLGGQRTRRGTLLSYATHASKINCIHVLIKTGAEIDRKDDDHFPAITLAADEGRHNSLNALIELGATVDICAHESDGWTPLIYAAMHGHAVCIKALIEAGANVNFEQKGESALQAAVVNQKTECAKIVLDAGAEPNIQDSQGYTPLMRAAYKNNSECVSLLLDANANIHLKNRAGDTALQLARENHSYDAQKLIENHKK